MSTPRLVLLCAALSLFGCDDSRHHGPGNGNGNGDGGSNGDGGPSNGLGCSADLQNVTTADGSVVQACPPDQGCFEGSCIAACDAAAMTKGNVGCSFMAATP